jgi:hypothetical protein
MPIGFYYVPAALKLKNHGIFNAGALDRPLGMSKVCYTTFLQIPKYDFIGG